jgi:preprotein translocase subunit SecD
VPHYGGDERGTLDVLLEMGQLDFWDTGSTGLRPQTSFDPWAYTTLNPAGPPFTGKDLDPAQIGVRTDQQTGRPQIIFEMKGDAIGRFGTFTGTRVGDYLTITLDRIVIASVVIQSAITGPGVISGNFTRQQATALVSVLKYPPLPIAVRISSESTFAL